MVDAKTAIKLSENIIWKSHLPYKQLIHPTGTSELPTTNLNGLSASQIKSITDRITTNIPYAAAA
jgi:hypothetical protein